MPTLRCLLAGAALCATATLTASVVAQPLPQGIADPREVSVSGLSSGAFMAVQLQVANARSFPRGVGVVAGGPYDCAESQLSHAYQGRCMTHRVPVPVAALLRSTRRWAAQGLIDPPATLAGARVFLFSGQNDDTVVRAVVNDARAFYQRVAPGIAIDYQRHPTASHAMVTDDFGNACGAGGPPFIEQCPDGDVAGRLLRHLYGPLQPRRAGALPRQPVAFDQTGFLIGRGLGATGYVYVPADCQAAGAGCRLHLALHGCQQNALLIGRQFIDHAGYNRWADSNRIVVLYPQTGPTADNGCWDWWGYSRADYARRSAPQLAALTAMVAWLTGQPAVVPPANDPRCSVATPLAHLQAGRASFSFPNLQAKGSGEPLGGWLSPLQVPLQRTAPGQFVVGNCT